MSKKKKLIFDYPLTLPLRHVQKLLRRDLRWRISETWRWRLSKTPDLSHHLDGLEQIDQIRSDEIVVLTRQYNSMRFLRSFLAHYRSLGADRIIIVDDNSTDGSREFLQAHPDVILLPARTSFSDADRGRNWLDAVLLRLPKRIRTIAVDIDEYLVFSDGQHKLPDLFAAMSRRRLTKICGLMLDLYPAPPISAAIFDGATEQMPWQVAPYFDADGYFVQHKKRGLTLTGGVRNRVFGELLVVSKFPAFFNPRRPVFPISIHGTQPLTKNTFPVGVVLLHFKYFNDFVEEHKAIASRGVHYGGAETYKAVLEQLDGVDVAESFSFDGPCTTPYQGPAQLCELGLMIDICK